jgi:hypothetical protein
MTSRLATRNQSHRYKPDRAAGAYTRLRTALAHYGDAVAIQSKQRPAAGPQGCDIQCVLGFGAGIPVDSSQPVRTPVRKQGCRHSGAEMAAVRRRGDCCHRDALTFAQMSVPGSIANFERHFRGVPKSVPTVLGPSLGNQPILRSNSTKAAV